MKSFKRIPKFIPELDPGFMPISLQNREYREALALEDEKVDVKVAIVGPKGFVSTTKLQIFPDSADKNEDNIQYVERLVKSLIWVKGGYKVIFAGPNYIGQHLKMAYTIGGERDFDVVFMRDVYDREFEIEITDYDNVPESNEQVKKLGRNLEGYRIGFDAGGSDRKVSAVVDGEAIYSEEVVWHPKITKDPEYHYQGILDSVKRAAEKMPRVDAIGISAAGIYIDNQVRAASLFRVIPKEDFEKRVKNIFYDVAANIGDVPIEVANDGDVTALAGAMSFQENCILGIAMGTSEAVGYVDKNGNITGWLNELAFVPVDYSENAIMDEWSLDRGVGVSYFSQDAVIKLSPNAGIDLDENLSPADKLKVVQNLMEKNDERAKKVYENIGIYLGYSLAYYSDFYDINKVLLLGRVVSGKGGDILIEKANEVLKVEFRELYDKIELITPDEKMKRVGQSIAAASLPNLSK
ncbi:putative NBD/HSP70 family sugar kinase [Sedimentibacter acidaminivorans]|uniref:NBD/HSP70 family sugar kinase n=1 Tax=Sedimentibacter acidaminivorans TaxID=913099 RepID=A0ABS4GAX5_9FIRM|nr:ROK family protein [Sedimentibacter acidaminivorans]MBP1924839.1 putative NBD/HSP70 family sugar kinase [Sedimentibacter acidaminivorans]